MDTYINGQLPAANAQLGAVPRRAGQRLPAHALGKGECRRSHKTAGTGHERRGVGALEVSTGHRFVGILCGVDHLHGLLKEVRRPDVQRHGELPGGALEQRVVRKQALGLCEHDLAEAPVEPRLCLRYPAPQPQRVGAAGHACGARPCMLRRVAGAPCAAAVRSCSARFGFTLAPTATAPPSKHAMEAQHC